MDKLRVIDLKDPPTDYDAFKLWALEAGDKVPQEFRHTAQLHITLDSDYDGPIIIYNIHYWSPENENEKAIREQSEARKREQDEKRQREEYERLKKKFELTT